MSNMSEWELSFKVKNETQLTTNEILMQMNGLSDDEKDWLLATLMERLNNVKMKNVILKNVTLKNVKITNSTFEDLQLTKINAVQSKIKNKNLFFINEDGKKKNEKI